MRKKKNVINDVFPIVKNEFDCLLDDFKKRVKDFEISHQCDINFEIKNGGLTYWAGVDMDKLR